MYFFHHVVSEATFIRTLPVPFGPTTILSLYRKTIYWRVMNTNKKRGNKKADERAIKRQRKGIRLVYTSKGRERENVMNNTSHAFLF